MGSPPNDLGKTYLTTFFGRLEQLGWVEGRSSRSEGRLLARADEVVE
jgi:hypothetical protein